MIRSDDGARRWRLRGGLRLWTLLVMLMVLGVWLGFHVKLSRDQQRGVAAIKKLGGTAHYTYQLSESGYDSTTEPPLPAWIWKWVGEDFFWRVMVADLHGKQIQHDDTELVA